MTDGFVEPMKCATGNLPMSSEWVYEIKFDGFRCLAVKNGSVVSLFSRNGNRLNSRFPSIVSAIQSLPQEKITIDGEVVALDSDGKASFKALQSGGEVFFYTFDILRLNGRDTTGLSLEDRKATLKAAIAGRNHVIRFSEFLRGCPILEIAKAMKEMGHEGIVAKKRHSTYEAGARSGAWVKIKWKAEQEFVIGGFTEPDGSRQYFGSALVGYYDGPDFIYVGKVGSGFGSKTLKSLYGKFEWTSATPFSNTPKVKARWVKPKLICQVRFAEWTQNGMLRQPVFVGMRNDKKPQDVTK